MKQAMLVLLMALMLCGCAAKGKKNGEPKPTGFASADAKNVHDFLARYPQVVMSGDVKAILRLYTEDARIVPLLGNFTRPVQARDLPKILPALVAEERKADLRLVFRDPMDIEVKGERAAVQVVTALAWKEKGKPGQAVVKCYFGLVRDENLLWKIREFHAEPVKSGFVLPPQAAPKKPLPPRDPKLRSGRGPGKKVKSHPLKPQQPAAQPASAPAPQAPPAPQDTETSPGPLVPSGEQNPQPLF